MSDVTCTHNDFLGRLSAMTDGEGTISYTYKTLANTVAGVGQVATITGPGITTRWFLPTIRWDARSAARRDSEALGLKSVANASQLIRRFEKQPERKCPARIREWKKKMSRNAA